MFGALHQNSFSKTLILAIHLLKMSTAAAEVSSCVFCNIVNKTENTELLYEDDDVAVFRDIKPATRFHILTVPKRHIEDVKTLTIQDKELLTKMLTVAKDMVTKNNLSVEDARFGYHWPPFRSVKHLHLHAIAPESEMGIIGKVVFMKDSYCPSMSCQGCDIYKNYKIPWTQILRDLPPWIC